MIIKATSTFLDIETVCAGCGQIVEAAILQLKTVGDTTGITLEFKRCCSCKNKEKEFVEND